MSWFHDDGYISGPSKPSMFVAIEENDTKFEKRSRIREKMYRYFDEGNAKRIVESLNIL